MQYKKLPGTGIEVSLLSLGTMTFGGQCDEGSSNEMMSTAFDAGINFFDTADVYTGGESERIVGRWLRGRRDEIILATKVCSPTGGRNMSGLSRRYILSAAESSLRRLNTDYIDIYYMHAPDYATRLEETLDAMTSLVRSGKVRYIGVSNFPAWMIADILGISSLRQYIAPMITQNAYNLIARSAQYELIPFLLRHGLGMAVYNPIAGGLLTGKHAPGVPGENTRFSINPGYYKRYWNDNNFDAVSQLAAIAADADLTLLQMAMRWCATRDGVTSVITGASKLSQLKENIAAVSSLHLPDEAIAGCDDVWKRLAGESFSYFRNA